MKRLLSILVSENCSWLIVMAAVLTGAIAIIDWLTRPYLLCRLRRADRRGRDAGPPAGLYFPPAKAPWYRTWGLAQSPPWVRNLIAFDDSKD
jgi:hypothetical protein